MEEYIAHITKHGEKNVTQTVQQHCRQTAKYAAQNLRWIGLTYTAMLCGLLHDMGKFTAAFNDYINKSSCGEKVIRGSVNHTFCGVIYLLERYHKPECDTYTKLACEIIAAAIGSHHGLFDINNPNQKNGFQHRLDKNRDDIYYDEACANFFKYCTTPEEIDDLMKKSTDEIEKIIEKIKQINFPDCSKGTAFAYCRGLTERLVLSALIDADRRDTAEFMQGKKHDFTETNKEFWKKQADFFESEYKKKILDKSAPTEINKARSYISDTSKNFAACKNGIYRMTVPTGGGKTLSTLRFALNHALETNKRRIIFTIPLLSILDQNAKIIKEYICGTDIVLEHHSNVIKDESLTEGFDKYELLAECWDAPIIVTTLVQLLNALFSGRTTAIRRMNAVCNSVIVIDEVQSIPKKLMYMFCTALNYLAYVCGCTIILCSATQPCFEALDFPIILAEHCDMIPTDKKLLSVFKRTDIIDKTDKYGMSFDDLADFSQSIFENIRSLLIICNTKNSAKEIFNRLKPLQSDDVCVFYLSTFLCMKHRQDRLNEINRLLDDKSDKCVICVSTQLVEAGVDFSFEGLIRVKAGIDNIAQAAGRCNRSGEYGKIGKVYVVSLKDEKLSRLPDIKCSQDAFNSYATIFHANSKEYSEDMLSPESIELYYKLLMKKHSDKTVYEYLVNGYSLFNLLSENIGFSKRTDAKDKYCLTQAFKTAGSEFTVFDDETTDVIVPYNEEAKQIICDLCSKRAEFDIDFLKRRLNAAKQYTISLFPYHLDKKEMFYTDESKHFIALREEYYKLETGFDINDFIF